MTFTVAPIGTIRTPWTTIADCPRNGRQPDPPPICEAEVFPPLRDGLASLEGFTHLILLYWMDRSRADAPLVFTPPFDTSPRGIFATRAPFRPNPIALSVVELVSIDPGGGSLKVRYLDCVSGTPLIDIKPYLPTTDAVPTATMGWLAPRSPPPSNR